MYKWIAQFSCGTVVAEALPFFSLDDVIDFLTWEANYSEEECDRNLEHVYTAVEVED
jgi:hypothetical protein